MLIPHGEGNVLAELYELGAPIEERTDRAGRRAASSHGFRAVRLLALRPIWSLRARRGQRGRDRATDAEAPPRGEAPGPRLRRGCWARSRRVRARSSSLPASGSSSRPGLAVAIPAGHAGFVQPRSGLAARARDHNCERTWPYRLRLPRRAQGLPPEHGSGAHLHGRSGRARGATRRLAGGRLFARLRSRSSPRASAASEASARRRAVDGAANPGVRDPPARREDPPLPPSEGRTRQLASAGRRSEARREPY